MFLGFRAWGFGAQGFGLVTSGKSQSYLGSPVSEMICCGMLRGLGRQHLTPSIEVHSLLYLTCC